MTKKIQHSFSSTSMFSTCPYQYQQVRLLKNFRSEAGEAALRGQELHKRWEEALGEDLSVGEAYQWVMDYVRKFPGLKVPEQQLAINEEFQPTDWFGDDVFYRAILDVMIINGDHLVVIDYKTGRFRLKERQGEEQVLLAMLHLPYINTAEHIFIWTDVDQAPTRQLYNRFEDGRKMVDNIVKIPREIQDAIDRGEFEKKKSGLCKAWCPVVSCPNNGLYTGDE